MTDDQRRIRDLESRLESEQIEVDMLNVALGRIRLTLAGDNAPADMLEDIRRLAYGVPRAPDIAA